jgi:hypothetical protein
MERSDDINSHRLAAHASSKNDVVNAIGLPQKVEKDDVQGTEVWLYTGKPINTSYFVPIPVAVTPLSSGLSTIHYVDAGSKNVQSGAPVVLALVFNRNGQLIEVQNKSK